MGDLFDGYGSTLAPRKTASGVPPFDEMFEAPEHAGDGGASRAAYKELHQALARLTQEELRGRTESLASSYLAQGVTFDFAKYDIKPQFYPALNTIANTLREYNQTIVEVSGHTDSVGSDAANQTLSERRANAVSGYLMGQGLQRERFEVVGMGERYPIASNDSEQGRALNRRVEIRLLPLQG